MVLKRFASILLLALISASASYASIGNTSPSIVNVINFVRGVEPRYESDLCGTLAREIDLVRSSKLPATWLIQYDALIDPRFLKVLRTLDANQGNS